MTAAPVLTEDDYLQLAQDLLPGGRAWPRDPETVLTGVLRGVALGFARLHGAALDLLHDGFPATAVGLLPEWEASCGLPDPCLGASPLVSERQAQLVARLGNTGGQSAGFFVGYAAALGWSITLEEFARFHVGLPVGEPLYGDAWAHHWQVNAPEFELHEFAVGVDAAGDPLADWGSTALQCEFARLMPGHTTLSFSYS